MRGLAIVGMVVFHLAWDLHDFGWTELDPSRIFGWELFGHAVACCFLFLSGLGLILARRRGAGIKSALRRIAVIASAALGVTLVTALATPGEMVRFGMLHCIALGNLLALPLLGVPVAVILSAAAGAVLVPLLVAGRAPTVWWWLGLSDQIPATVDVRPLLPWLAVVLFGVGVGRLGGAAWIRDHGREELAPQPLAAAGRHSLLIYLVHQPILFGLLWALSAVLSAPASQVQPESDFDRQCQAACVTTVSPDRCGLFCACARRHLERQSPRTPPAGDVIAEAARACGAGGSRPVELHGD